MISNLNAFVNPLVNDCHPWLINLEKERNRDAPPRWLGDERVGLMTWWL